MTTDNRTIDRQKLAMISWVTMLASGPVIFAVLYLSDAGQGGGGMAAEYELWFLAAGIVSSLFSLPATRRFREAAEARRTEEDDEAYWQRLNAMMSTANAVAEIPLFIGLAAYLAGGFTRTALLLLVLSLALQSRLKPLGR